MRVSEEGGTWGTWTTVVSVDSSSGGDGSGLQECERRHTWHSVRAQGAWLPVGRWFERESVPGLGHQVGTDDGRQVEISVRAGSMRMVGIQGKARDASSFRHRLTFNVAVEAAVPIGEVRRKANSSNR